MPTLWAWYIRRRERVADTPADARVPDAVASICLNRRVEASSRIERSTGLGDPIRGHARNGGFDGGDVQASESIGKRVGATDARVDTTGDNLKCRRHRHPAVVVVPSERDEIVTADARQPQRQRRTIAWFDNEQTSTAVSQTPAVESEGLTVSSPAQPTVARAAAASNVRMQF